MKAPPRPRAFALTDLLALLAAGALLAAMAVPALGRLRQGSQVTESMANLSAIAFAQSFYAFDWNDRQVTHPVDGVAAFGADATTALSNYQASTGQAHPPVLAGFCEGGSIWGYWFDGISSAELIQPLIFDGSLVGVGTHRLPNMRPLHEYLGGRFYEPAFYAPDHDLVADLVEPLFESPLEFIDVANPVANFYYPSYTTSPAAHFDPGVFRPEAEGGFQDPWSFDEGMTVPPVTAVLHPHLKTQLIEHYWFRDAPMTCNPAIENGSFGGCEPYFFNHGVDAAPVAAFYDGHVRIFPNGEAIVADQTVLDQTGGVDGLWHRGTPFGTNGYFIDIGFDGAPLSHHVLTTGGIQGRDTIEGAAIAGQSPRGPARSPLLGTGRHVLSQQHEDMTGVQP